MVFFYGKDKKVQFKHSNIIKELPEMISKTKDELKENFEEAQFIFKSRAIL